MNWKGGKIIKNCLTCNNSFEVFIGRKNTAKYCSKNCHDKSLEGVIPWNKGKSHSRETREKMSLAHKGKSAWNKGIKRWWVSPTQWVKKDPRIMGKNQHDWKGGVTPIRIKLRHSFQYEEWRKAVFERDLYTCSDCGSIGEYLHADHIKPFSSYPDLRFEVSNGRTLCVPCHYLRTWGKKITSNNKWGHRYFRKEEE